MVLAALCTIFAASSAEAQLSLRDTLASSPTAKTAKDSAHHKTSKAAGREVAYGAASVSGRDLLLNGANGLLRLSGQPDALQIDRFTMLGEVISDPTQQCRIDIIGEAAIRTKSAGRSDGLPRVEVDIPACPFEFEILDGAVLVPSQLQACIFKDADCQANPSGLWGPVAASLATNAKLGEQGYARAGTAMAVNYRALEARLKDRAGVDRLVYEQNRFLSDREDICRAYSHEDFHKFCRVQLTEARAAFLKARIDELPPDISKSPRSSAHQRKPPH